MNKRYCYWSVATGPYSALMERCVASARQCGVFKEFHVLTDRAIEGCECYDAQEIDKEDGMFKLIYLKAGMTKLLFDYFIWVDADSLFVRNPRNVLECLGKSPIHVPLTTNLSVLEQKEVEHDNERNGSSLKPAFSSLRGQGDFVPSSETAAGLNLQQYIELMTGAGVYNPVYLSGSSFWIVQREAIDRVVELATHFRGFAKQKGASANVSVCLGYAMQMLCANPEMHRVKIRPDLWASDDAGQFLGSLPEDVPWLMKDALANQEYEVNPCIIHLPHSKSKNLNEQPPSRGSEQAPPTEENEKADYAQTF